MRVVGATAIALAASMAIQNACWLDRTSRLRGPDRGGAHLARGEPVHGRDRGRPGGAAPAAAARFVTGLHGLVGRRGWRGRVAPRGGRGRDSSAVFALYAVLWIGVVLSAGDLAEPSPAFELAWQLHAAAFALALPALGTTSSALRWRRT